MIESPEPPEELVGREQLLRYAQEKAAWAEAHPEATAHEYEHAIRRIAAEFGI